MVFNIASHFGLASQEYTSNVHQENTLPFRHLYLRWLDSWSSVIDSLATRYTKLTFGSIEQTCAPSTITITETPSPVTVTLHDSFSIPVPTVTVKSLATLQQPDKPPSIVPGESFKNQIEAESTIYNTIFVTVVVDAETPTTEDGLLSFIVVEGTTSWLGATPAPGELLVFATTVAIVTIVPQQSQDLSVVLEPTTTTTRSTTYTSTVTLLDSTTFTIVDSGIFTGKPVGGWNSTSSTANIPPTDLTSATAATQSQPTTLTAESNFHGYTTLIAQELTSDLSGTTTAVIDGVSLSWIVSSASVALTGSSSPPTTLLTVTSPTSTSSSAILGSNETTSSRQLTSSIDKTQLPSTTTTSFVISSPSACGITGDFVLNVSFQTTNWLLLIFLV